jgi:hypothetical protein
MREARPCALSGRSGASRSVSPHAPPTAASPRRPRTPDIYSRYLSPTAAEAYNPEYARRIGYTHLLGPATHHQQTMARAADRVRTEDPDFYARCEFACSELAQYRT